MTTVTRYVGTCPVCEGEFKLHRLKMVHHGYKRPGYGEIVGDCPGVGWAPFEMSPDGAVDYLERVLLPALQNSTTWLAKLQSGEVTELRQEIWTPRGEPAKWKILTPADGYEFKSELKTRVRTAQHRFDALTRDAERFDNRIRGWVERPVRTEQEVLQVQERMTSERRSKIDEARAAKRAKRDALDTKQRAREQEQLDLIKEYRDIFNQLAFESQQRDVSREAKGHWVAMQKRKNKKGYLHFYDTVLDIPEALVALKLAVPRIRGETPRDARDYNYANEFGWEPQPYR